MFAPESPFRIAVPDSQLALLHQKLELATLPDELEGAGTAYGAALPDMQRLVNRWRSGYNWRKHEAELNAELPQFTRDIDVDGFGTLNVHYVHKRSEVEGAIPLLFVHGWPGSFLEVRKVLPLLVEASPDHPSFHVVAISLPGFGFSAAPKKKGFALNQYAEVSHKAMLALGYDEYVTQGGDWGFFITRRMASLYGPKHVKAWHTNFPCTSPPSFQRPLLLISHLLSYLPFLGYTEKEKAGLERTIQFRDNGSSYFAIQSTRPQTLGYGLTDSPVGLLGWIYEKLAASLEGAEPFDDDEYLTWVSIYYFSRAGPAASLRIYYEVVQSQGRDLLAQMEPTTIPMGYSYFPREAVRLPRSWLGAPNLVFESEHKDGGHFAAFEKPELLVGDVRKMFGKGGPAYRVVKDKDGSKFPLPQPQLKVSPALMAFRNAIDSRRLVGVHAERVTNVSSTDYPGHYPDEDHSWNLAKFRQNLKVKVQRLSQRSIEFDLVGVDASIANAFRRILIAEVPTVCIEHVYAWDNTSVIQDEVLAHRIGMVPLNVDPALVEMRDASNQATDRNTIVFRLKVLCERNPSAPKGSTDPAVLYKNHELLSSHLVWQPAGEQADVFAASPPAPTNPNIVLAKLRPGQAVEMELHAVKGVGKDHAKFSPVATASYRLLPHIVIKKPIPPHLAEKFQKCFAPGVINVDPRTKEVSVDEYNVRRDTVSREVLRHPEFADSVELSRIRDHFLFSIESESAYAPERLLPEAIQLMRRKIATLRKAAEALLNLEEGDGDVQMAGV
ncbi:putative epoxide hydrolase [Lyophyllum shimeji]|uniref:DNA-directed RNA polymerases I and III subunit RPAC1 n=1 Tax=Lyophyllum shimeji TaxID=47721 RepID=A0A9P3UMB1_LYOSH|nr:putative epoxide hydrolase [Lyophyllum shimeji]